MKKVLLFGTAVLFATSLWAQKAVNVRELNGQPTNKNSQVKKEIAQDVPMTVNQELLQYIASKRPQTTVEPRLSAKSLWVLL
jgi:hypothetical protein